MILLEIMLAVMIFSIAVIALGRCLNNCITAQSLRSADARARQALVNRMAELTVSPAVPDVTRKTELQGAFAGITLEENRKTLNLKNEQDVALTGLYEMTLSAEWNTAGAPESRTLKFLLLRPGT